MFHSLKLFRSRLNNAWQHVDVGLNVSQNLNNLTLRDSAKLTTSILNIPVTFKRWSSNSQGPSYSSKNKDIMEKFEVSGMRKPYKGKQDIFDVGDLVSKEPYEQFYAWFEEAKKTDGIMEANAMSLATATSDGKPSVRMVLMKGIDKNGVVFYTNFLSRKAKELIENPNCCLMFYWEPLMKMVRIEGTVEKVSDAESTEYFHSRPRASQIGACVSQQSLVVKDRKVLDERNEELTKKYADESIPVPKPDYWGGFRVVPSRFEFWQGQTNRLHDRIVFRRPQEGENIDPEVTHLGTDGWVYERLMP